MNRARWAKTFISAALVVAVGTSVQVAPAFAGSVDLKAPFVCGTSYIGSTYPGHSPHAVDFNQPGGADRGDPVLASAAGNVIDSIPWDGKITIEHAGGHQTIYAHMTGITVRVGDTVGLGTILGHIGMVGNATGPHLHYQQLINGTPVPVRFEHVLYRMGSAVKSTNCSGNPGKAARPSRGANPKRASATAEALINQRAMR